MTDDNHITLKAHDGRLRVLASATVLADTTAAIELHETGYPVRYYIPRHDIAMEYLSPSVTTTHCPYKGDATYYSIRIGAQSLNDAAWSYEQPFTAMQAIAGQLAFADESLILKRG